MPATLFRILLGVDMALGLWNYVFWSWLAGQRFNVFFLVLSVFATHLPDGDMIPYLLLRRRWGLVSHWVIGHHPMLLLPLVTLAGWAAARMWLPDQVGYTVALLTAGVFLHLAHDGLNGLGFPWLSPLSRTHFRFRVGKSVVVPPAEVAASLGVWKTRDCSVGEEISGRAAPIGFWHGLFWGAALLALIWFIVVGSQA